MFPEGISYHSKAAHDETEKQCGSILEIKGRGVPGFQALLAPCGEERIRSHTAVPECEKHQEVIGGFSDNPVRTNHHCKGDRGCRAGNTSHF